MLFTGLWSSVVKRCRGGTAWWRQSRLTVKQTLHTNPTWLWPRSDVFQSIPHSFNHLTGLNGVHMYIPDTLSMKQEEEEEEAADLTPSLSPSPPHSLPPVSVWVMRTE